MPVPEFFGRFNPVRHLKIRLQWLPQRLRPYVIAVGALVGACAVAALLLRTIGPRATIVVSLLGDLVFLGSAWLGYGPGLVVCFLLLFVAPRVLVPGKPHPVDLGQFALLVIISLLVSRLSQTTRRSEVQLRRQEQDLRAKILEDTVEIQRLADIVESSDDAIIGISTEGAITSWNGGAEKLSGYTARETIGHPFAAVVAVDSEGDAASVPLPIGTQEPIRNLEVKWVRKDGRRVPVSLTVSPILGSGGTIQGGSIFARDITAARRAQQALEESERRYRLLFDNNPQPMWVYDQATLEFLTVNETAVRSYGYAREEFLRMTLKDIRPEEDIPKLLESTATPPTGLNKEGPWRHRKKNGQIISVEITEHPLQYGEHAACLVMATDITERLRLEEQFRQSQRLESVGRLAGGVAHDFNNLLTVINGYSDMLLKDLAPGDPGLDAIGEIREAGERAAGLTQQLLAFSRRQVMQLAVLDLNAVVATTKSFLRRLIGEDVELVTKLSPELGSIQADAVQIQQIIMNLAVNSRDAMPHGGTLLIETANAVLDESYRAEYPGIRPGPYVMLAITDTGVGMSQEVQARIFEPFFTTKELGKGTGLGLATVYGMVKQGGGWIWVYSEPARGTTFKIYFPRTDQTPSAVAPVIETDLHGTETILVVEDQTEVRVLTVTGLSRFGYTVHGFATGREALAFCDAFHGDIHLVITDVVMPDMNGREVAAQIARIRPAARVLFMSGYTTNVIVHHGALDADVEYLQKPFTPASLARRVREVLAPAAE